MCDGLIVVVSFFSGVFLVLIFYSIISAFLGEEDKLIVYRLRKKTKKERIEKLEYEVETLKSKLSNLDYPLLLSVKQFEYSRRMAERNKNK